MKRFALTKIFTLAVTGLFFCSSIHAQSRADIFDENSPLIWMGIDFTETLYVGDRNDVSAVEMKDFFKQINELLLEETGRYNLKKTFHKKTVTPKVEMLQKQNAEMDTNKLTTSKMYQYNRLTKEYITSMIQNYETGEIRGTAAVIILEDLNKTWETGSMWVAYFNAQTKEVMLAVKLLGEASGFGFRNHWASTIDDVLSQVQSKEYKKWQQLYGGKKK